MEKGKRCPLLASCPDFPPGEILCKGARCAWWCGDATGGCCALVALANEAGEIATWAEEIRDTRRAACDRQYPRMARRGPEIE